MTVNREKLARSILPIFVAITTIGASSHSDQIVRKYGEDPRITRWQASNEPFHFFGPHNPTVGYDHMESIINTIRKHSSKEIRVTDFGELNIFNRDTFDHVIRYGDSVGIDIYQKIDGRFIPSQNIRNTLRRYIHKAGQHGKDIDILELPLADWGKSTVNTYDINKLLYITATEMSERSTIYLWDVIKLIDYAQSGRTEELEMVRNLLQ